MKKITSALIACFVLAATYTFAGETSNNVQFQFANTDLVQNSWDYASLHCGINDLNSGQVFDIPASMITYEVKDKSGNVVSKGIGSSISIQDAKMGSEEEYTIVVSTLINGQKITHTLCKKASPKKFAMKLNPTDLDHNHLAYTFTRPKFNNPNETENVPTAASDVQVNIMLNNTSYKIQVGAGHPALAAQADYITLKNEMKKLAAEGRVAEIDIEPKLVFKGEVYTDTQTYYQVTGSSFREVSSLDPIASK